MGRAAPSHGPNPLSPTQEPPHAHSSHPQLGSYPQLVLKSFLLWGSKRKSILCRRKHTASGSAALGTALAVSAAPHSQLWAEELLPAVTHFTQDLLSKAKFGEFSVCHHCFDAETAEDVLELQWSSLGSPGHWGRMGLWLIFTQFLLVRTSGELPPSKPKALSEASSASPFMRCFYPELRDGVWLWLCLAVFVLLDDFRQTTSAAFNAQLLHLIPVKTGFPLPISLNTTGSLV